MRQEAAALASLSPAQVTVDDRWLGSGYGEETNAAHEAVFRAGSQLDLALETTYTGKAVSGMLRKIMEYKVFREEPNQ